MATRGILVLDCPFYYFKLSPLKRYMHVVLETWLCTWESLYLENLALIWHDIFYSMILNDQCVSEPLLSNDSNTTRSWIRLELHTLSIVHNIHAWPLRLLARWYVGSVESLRVLWHRFSYLWDCSDCHYPFISSYRLHQFVYHLKPSLNAAMTSKQLYVIARRI